MNLSEVEIDLLGDLAADTHGVWEVFEHVRGHQPQASDAQVFETGRSILKSWSSRGWLAISNTPICPTAVTTLDEALAVVDQLGPKATRYFEGAPSIDLTHQAKIDVPWLGERAG